MNGLGGNAVGKLWQDSFCTSHFGIVTQVDCIQSNFKAGAGLTFSSQLGITTGVPADGLILPPAAKLASLTCETGADGMTSLVC